MDALKNLAGGLAGAIALTVLHETYRRFDNQAPRIDLVGEQALTKSLKSAGIKPPKGNSRYGAALAGDLIGNALYFSLIGSGGKKFSLIRGAVYGLAAGAGALKLPEPLGLSDAPVTRTERTKALTVAWYVFGGIVAAIAIKSMKK